MPFLLLVGAAPMPSPTTPSSLPPASSSLYGIPASLMLMVVVGFAVYLLWPLMGMPLRALEPRADNHNSIKNLIQFGFSHEFVSDLRKKQRLKAAPLKDLCRKSYELKVEDFMQTTAEGECIDHEATLDIAIHTLVLGNHLSLMVTKDKQIIGVLRLSDVFAAVFHSMKECSV
jgi:Mg2+/Co2+ transporter CorB